MAEASKGTKKFTPPFLGAAYYPEAWPVEQIDEDIALMKKAGMTVMRIGEFAWNIMEPEEGTYNFGWLHNVVDKLGEAGIASIMCTPTCTPPAWMTEKYPDILPLYENGSRMQHGGRRHSCNNNPEYRKYTEIIVAKIAQEFGNDENVIGWQIDNEICPKGEMETRMGRDGRGCCCPVCQKKFRDSLREQFKTIDNLNKAWGTNVWSQSYQSFEQIPYPKTDTWHHPSLQTAWMLFKADSCIEFIGMQADILHKYAKQPVGTDMLPSGSISFAKMHKKLDVCQMNHYTSTGQSRRAVFMMDFARTVKEGVPFWNTETATCWHGGFEAKSYRGQDYCRGNSWLPIALGGEATLYWLWRNHWSGQELMHGSVVNSYGRPMFIFNEVVDVTSGFNTAKDFLNSTKVNKPEFALHFSNKALWMFKFQPQTLRFDYMESLFNQCYKPVTEMQLRCDVIEPVTDIDDYKIIYSPFLPALDEEGLRERLITWIENGGTWVAGPMTDNRTVHAARFLKKPFGSIEEWAGIYCEHEIPFDKLDFTLSWTDGGVSTGAINYCGFSTADKEAEVLAVYDNGPLKGLAAVTQRRIGKGKIIVLGTMLDPDSLKKLIGDIALHAGIKPVAQASSNILYAPRSGSENGARGAVAVELENRPGYIIFDKPVIDILTGDTLQGKIEVKPQSVFVLKEL